MIRLLIIGRPAEEWARRIRRAGAESLTIDTARLPSAGIRQFQSTPADLIVVADDRGGERVEILARAIRQRPLGKLVPLLLLCPLPDKGSVDERIDELDLVDWLPAETPPKQLVTTLEKALDADLRSPSESSPCESGDYARDAERQPASGGEDDDTTSPQPPRQTADGSASYFDGDIVLQPVDKPSTTHQRVDQSSVFRRPTGDVDASKQSVDAEEIERKLKAVRHDDYYTILEIRRGAEHQTVREAFHQLSARFDPDAIDFQLLRRFQDEIAEIRDALEDAFAVLGDPDLRRSYLEHTLR